MRILFLKTHVDSYTKKDGTFVAAHEDRRAAAKKNSPAPSHEPMPDFIEIDGKQRSTKNSDGKPIYPTIEGVKNFWKWFGDSEVTDKKGRPKVVYHGTDTSFTAFDASKSDGFWFTDNKDALLDDNVGANGSGIIVEAYLKADNLLLNGPNSDVESIVNDGYDGIENRYEYGIDYAVIDPNQIKSATGNNGDFSPDDPTITKAILFLKS